MIPETEDIKLKIWKNEDCPYLRHLKNGKWACSRFRFFECEMLMNCKVTRKREDTNDSI